MKKLFTIFIVGASTICLAQHSVFELIDYGLNNSLEIKRAIIDKTNSSARLKNSYFDLSPNGTISIGKNKSYDLEDNTFDSESSSLSISKSVSLDDPTYFNIRSNEISNQNSVISFEDNKKQIATNIFLKYVNVLQDNDNLQIAKENADILRRTYEISLINFENGNISNYELQNAELNLLNQEIQIDEYENRLKESRHELFTYINMADDNEELLIPEISMEITKVKNYENNKLKILANNIKNSKLHLRQQRLKLFPMPSININYSYGTTTDIIDFDTYDDNLSVGINVSYNIFDIPNIRNNYLISQREFEYEKMSYEIEEYDNRINIDFTLEKLRALQKSYKLQERKLALSKENYAKAEKQYELGLINLNELETSRVNLFSAQVSKKNKYYEFLKKQEELNLLISDKILGRY
jgi:outer membrane protein